MTNYWTLYGAVEPAADPQNPPPACLGQVWVRAAEGRESLVNDIVVEEGTRVPYCFGVPHYAWPPDNAVLVSGPHAPWKP